MLRKLLPIVLLFAAACRSTSSEGVAEERASIPSAVKTQQRLALEDFVANLAFRVERAADAIVEAEPAPEIRRNAVFLKMRVIPMARRTLEHPDDRTVYLELWLVTIGMRLYFEQEPDFFGDSTRVALDTAKDLEEQVVALGPRVLKAKQLEEVQTAVDSFAESVEGQDVRRLLEERGQQGAIEGVVGGAFSLVKRPLQQVDPTAGLSDTAGAVYRVAGEIGRSRTELNYLPDNLRWQTELLVLELEGNHAVRSALDSFASVSESAVKLSDVAATLPEDLRFEITHLVDEIDQRQAGLQGTLQEVQKTLTGVDGTLERVQPLIVSTDATAQSVTKMGEVYTRLVETVDAFIAQFKKDEDAEAEEAPPAPPEEPAKERPPFDINDYGRTAARRPRPAPKKEY